MVTRKPVGLPLDTTAQQDGQNRPPYPATPTVDSSKFPASTNSIYSPSLDSSPAFDLVDMEQARQKRSQRRDSDVSSHGTWDSDGDDDDGRTPDEGDIPQPLRITPSRQNLGETVGEKKDGPDTLPAALRPGPVGGEAAARRSQDSGQHANPWATEAHNHSALESNNPYLRNQKTGATAAWPPYPATPSSQGPPPPSSAPPAPPIELPTIHTPSAEMSQMSLKGDAPHDAAESQNAWASQQPTPEEKWNNAPEVAYPPPPGPPPMPHNLMHQDQPMSQPLPGTVSSRMSPPAIAIPPPPSASMQPRTSIPETPGTRTRRQNSEHYQIKHVNWLDGTSMKQSPILTQNANGPCPLLALVNALVLSTPREADTALLETLRTREQVSLGLLLDAVFDELMSGRRGDTAQELPDVSELYAFLLALHTGMNVNPRFVPPMNVNSMTGVQSTRSGGFEQTREMRLYATFGLPLVHGWVPSNSAPAYDAFSRTAQTFEDAQNVQFAESELGDNSRSEGLSGAEQQTLQDIHTIKSFLNNWPTQLTDHGLESMSRTLPSGQVAILFRNDHFSTLYKEPKHGALMTLVTDAGYGSHDEIVWESLVDVNGAASEMFSGDFRVVSHRQDARLNQGNSGGGNDGWETVPMRNRHSQPLAVEEQPPPLPGPRPTSFRDSSRQQSHVLSPSEQEDHDLALALQIQEEEESSHRQAEAQRRREAELSEQFLSRESTSGPPTIPPRRGAGRVPSAGGVRPGVTRPTAPGDPEAPPSYAQSRVDRPYREDGTTPAPVAQGNPLNAYDALRRQQQQPGFGPGPTLQHQQTGSIAGSQVHGRRPSAGRGRRTSQGVPGAFGSVAPGGGMGGGPGARPHPPQKGTVQEAEERCSVM
ncbi:hypothetical protein B0A48_09527 [Cryoendolithus antarcticus]|uniref:MINDY deubiquitinase domain-containing protein n=1 Tax=Cryoendolithus antarcticus TaxID=1507870 RepID=A0A1V8SZL2_9PEZI|nr:hypothetical protein B0A48_09527 [Cryoendolithus antarcticus]